MAGGLHAVRWPRGWRSEGLVKIGLPGLRTLGVVTVVVALLLAGLDTVGRMDARFFGDSLPGTRALFHYLIGDYRNAAQWYRVAFARSPVRATTSSWAALRAGDHEKAATLARRELEQEPRAIQPRLTLAEVALARRQHAEALEYTAQVLALQPEEYDALLLTTVARAHRNEWNEALDALKRALRQNRAERRYTVFLSVLELASDLRNVASPPLCLIAHVHRYLRLYDPGHAGPAVRYARHAIESGDRADDGWVTLAVLDDTQGRRRRAIERFDRAIALNPRNTAALLGAARLRADRGEMAAEYQLVQAAFRATPDDPVVADRFFELLVWKLGDYRQALANEEAAVAARPGDAKAWWRRGIIQLSLADYEASLASFERAAVAGHVPEAYDGQGDALLRLRRYEQAAAAFQRSIEIDKSRPGPFVGLAVVHARTRHYPQALAAYERAHRLGAIQVDQVVDLCSLYYETGNVSQASLCLREALTREPDNVRGRALLGHVNKTANRRAAL